MTRPAAYDADVDEMTAMGLTVLAELRAQLATHFAHDPGLTATITGIVDSYAGDLVALVHDDDDASEPGADDEPRGPLQWDTYQP